MTPDYYGLNAEANIVYVNRAEWENQTTARLTLATLCDMVLGEEASDRSDEALLRAVGKLQRDLKQARERSEHHASQQENSKTNTIR